MPLKRVKSANKRFKYSVFGYLRNQEADQFNYICLNYYLSTEIFRKLGKNMKVNGMQDTVMRLNNFSDYITIANTAYGETKTDCNYYYHSEQL